MYLLYLLHFFFFKQKTVYEMRISNCSSDVCSSDLAHKKRAGVTSGPFLKSLRCRSGAGDVGRVDLYAGAHRRRQRDLFDILDRKSVVSGKSVSVCVDRGGRRTTRKENQTKYPNHQNN